MSQFRRDDSARLEKKVLLSDSEGERNDASELAITRGSVEILKVARKRISDERTTYFSGNLGAVGDELLDDVGMKVNTGSSLPGSITPTMDDCENLINATVSAKGRSTAPGPEIDEDGVATEYEVALKYLGFGPFHVFLMIVNGIALCSDAVEILSLAFVLPVLNKPDEFGMSNAEGAVLSSVIFIGMLFGSYIWGSVADIAGRRTTLLLSLTCSGVFGLASAFVPSFWLFTLMRFFSGFGVGGSLPVLYPYNSEFIRNKYRGPFLSLQSIFWMFGRFMCGGFAWILIPMTNIQASFGSYQFHSWRIFLAISALPSILGALLYLVMPETPRYLLEVGKERKAIKILQMVHRVNNICRKNTPEYPVNGIHLDRDIRGTAWFRHSNGQWKNFINKFTEILKRTSELYRRKLLRTSLLLMIIMFSLSFSSYGVLLWFPTYVGEITAEQEQASFDANCQQNVTNFSSESLQGYCNCKNTVFQDALITGARLESWMISSATFSNVTFRNVTFDNVFINSSLFVNHCVFHNCTIENSRFLTLNLSGASVLSLNISSSFLCDLHGLNESDPLTVNNSSLNGNFFNQTRVVNGSIFNDDSTCLTDVPDSSISCDQSKVSTVYRDSFFISASTLPANLVSAVAVYLFRRNYWLAFTLFLSTVSVFLLYVVHSEVFVVIMLCLFTALSTPAWNDATLIIAEVYPTHLRATAAGVHLLMARIGAIIGTNIFGAFVHVNPSIPIITVASVMLVSVIAALPLPKTTRKTLLK